MSTISRITCLWLFCTAFTAAGIGAETASPLLQAMRAELKRSVDLLKRQPVPPYFLSYEITETHAGDSVPFRFEDNSSLFSGTLRGRPVLTSIVTPRMVLFEDITLKPPTGEIPKAPVSPHPYFDG